MTEGRADGRAAALAGTIAVAATYTIFLLFAQFGLLALVRERVGLPAVEPVLAAMGLAGLVASLATPRLLAGNSCPVLLRAGFIGCTVGAGASLVCSSAGAFAVVAALVGASCGLLTVSLASELRAILGARPGLKAGGATGIAYLFCNLPGVFDAPPARQAVLVAGVGLLGVAAAGRATGRGSQATSRLPPRGLFHGAGFVGVLCSLFALIWLDSTAFRVIQENSWLKVETWGTPTQTVRLGVFHALGALAAGGALDRGAFRSLLVASSALFATAITALDQRVSPGLAGPLYAVAVSLYSVALVVFPSARGDEPGLLPARWRAAIAFGVCGWLGSAAGVGMARGLHEVPAWVVWTSLLLVVVPGLLEQRASLRTLLRQHALTLGAAAASLALHATSGGVAPDDAVARGRRVYIDEGCINCHSQYVRPAARDRLWWGPEAAPDTSASPPLIGNRRQGPDLATVGLRRNEGWLRLHMIDPHLVSPGSKMPSYRQLFAPGDGRGDDLVAYLASLGAEDLLERAHWAAGQPAGAGLASGDRERGAALFDNACTACHGASGRGDGPLAGSFDGQWLDLGKPELWLVAAHPEQPAEQVLARLIRFGLIGGSMPGHEYWTDREIADVVAHVRSLGGESEAPGAGP